MNRRASEQDDTRTTEPRRLDIISSAEGDFKLTEDTSGMNMEKAGQPKSNRSWVGIYFECCGVYARILRTPDADRYEGRCPKCMRTVRLRVGADGVSDRIFRASPVPDGCR